MADLRAPVVEVDRLRLGGDVRLTVTRIDGPRTVWNVDLWNPLAKRGLTGTLTVADVDRLVAALDGPPPARCGNCAHWRAATDDWRRMHDAVARAVRPARIPPMCARPDREDLR